MRQESEMVVEIINKRGNQTNDQWGFFVISQFIVVRS